MTTFFSSKDCLEYSFCSVGLGDFGSIHRGNEFCFKTILCLNPHLYHLGNPSYEKILEGAQKKKKPVQRLRSPSHVREFVS